MFKVIKSPPARGAWIEITAGGCLVITIVGRPPHGGRGLKLYLSGNGHHLFSRRPPHGGRGLKFLLLLEQGKPPPSPPARGAWIEIAPPPAYVHALCSRPPHGGRGLKSPHTKADSIVYMVAPRTGGVD